MILASRQQHLSTGIKFCWTRCCPSFLGLSRTTVSFPPVRHTYQISNFFHSGGVSYELIQSGIGKDQSIASFRQSTSGNLIHSKRKISTISMATVDAEKTATSHVSDSPKVILVSNGKIEETSLTAADFLGTYPRGAYTTARTVDRHSIFEFEFHVARLVQSVNLMMKAAPKEGQSSEAASQITLHSEITNVESLRPIVVENVKAGLLAFASAFPEFKGELKVTMLLTWTNEGHDLTVHLTTLPSPPSPPVRVEIRGNPRSNALAKDSEWVRERKVLEATKPANVNEILLMGEDGSVYEGMTSNFFVVQNGEVVTAGDGILLGTVREVALDACKEHGVGVVLRAPNVSEVNTWEGAFISSTSRLVLPIDELVVPRGEGDQILQFNQPLVHNLSKWVKDVVATNSTRIL